MISCQRRAAFHTLLAIIAALFMDYLSKFIKFFSHEPTNQELASHNKSKIHMVVVKLYSNRLDDGKHTKRGRFSPSVHRC